MLDFTEEERLFYLAQKNKQRARYKPKEKKIRVVKEKKLILPKKEKDHIEIRMDEYIKRSNKKKQLFALDYNTFKNIVEDNCSYCGANYTETKMTIDRIDSKIGYIESNIQPCCYKCNTMKFIYSEEVFLDQVKKIFKYKKF